MIRTFGSSNSAARFEPRLAVPLCCPKCHRPLTQDGDALCCPGCERSYPLVEGVAHFTPTDSFYEGRWARPDLSAGSLRNWLVKKERFFLRRLRGKKGVVLDLGCGGGWRFFTRLGPVAGVDLSHASLRQAAHLYDVVALAELGHLPFGDDSFDFVVSLDVLGHVPPGEKDAVLAEIRRVLRPGGKTLHYIETEAADPLSRFERRYPDLYQRYIVEPEGHHGLESPPKTFVRFRRAGFRPKVERPAYKMFRYVGRVVQQLDNDYARKSPLVGSGVSLAKGLGGNRYLEMGANLLVALALEVGDRLLPGSWAGGVMVEYQK